MEEENNNNVKMKSRRKVWSGGDLMGIPALVLKCLTTVLSSPTPKQKYDKYHRLDIGL